MEIIIDNLSYSNKNSIFLDSISLTIEKKSIIGVIGTSKSVLLNLISGNINYDQGTIALGETIVNKENSNLVKSTVAIVHQDVTNRFITDNVKAEMILSINKARYQNPNMKEHMLNCLAMVGLTPDYLDRSLKSLSIGEKKLVSLAMALVSEPKILLLDEIMVDLDFTNKKKIIQLIKSLHDKEEKTIVLATNDSNLLYQLVDKIVVIADAKVQAYDTPQVVFTKTDMLNRCNIDMPDLVAFTYLASQKNVKLSFHKDIRDLIKDVYKHVE